MGSMMVTGIARRKPTGNALFDLTP